MGSWSPKPGPCPSTESPGSALELGGTGWGAREAGHLAAFSPRDVFPRGRAAGSSSWIGELEEPRDRTEHRGCLIAVSNPRILAQLRAALVCLSCLGFPEPSVPFCSNPTVRSSGCPSLLPQLVSERQGMAYGKNVHRDGDKPLEWPPPPYCHTTRGC